MFKRLLGIMLVCALIAGAYVQETGRNIPYVSAAVQVCTQHAQKCWELCAVVARSTLALLEKTTQQNTAIKQPPASAQQTFVSGAHVTASGIVVRILPDDNVGIRHQRFIVKFASGRTLLIAHNIDLAPRIANLRPGDAITVCGEYASNEKGDVIHWTHHDPAGRHPAGWIQHGGKTYQ